VQTREITALKNLHIEGEFEAVLLQNEERKSFKMKRERIEARWHAN
jgi:hypothetical protein